MPVPPLRTAVDSVRAATCTLTSATANPAPVSGDVDAGHRRDKSARASLSVSQALLCASVSGNWGPWSSWGSCSKTCNGGQMRRYRTCDNPRPANGGRACAGADTQIQRCSTANCPGESGQTPKHTTATQQLVRIFWVVSLQLMVSGVLGSHGETAPPLVAVERGHVFASVTAHLLVTVVARVQVTPPSCPGVALRRVRVSIDLKGPHASSCFFSNDASLHQVGL